MNYLQTLLEDKQKNYLLIFKNIIKGSSEPSEEVDVGVGGLESGVS